MALKYNNTEVENVLFNGQQVEILKYNGTTVWENIKVIYLGEGTSFDVKTKFPKWANLNANNFYITTSSALNETNWTAKTVYGDRSDGVAQSHLYKSYSNGVLTCYVKYRVTYHDSNGDGPRNYDTNRSVKAYLITKAPIDLGTAKTFDVKNIYPNYSQLTVDDFYISEVTPYSYTGFSARWSYDDRNNGKAISRIVKSYEPSTGILTCYLQYQWDYRDSNGVAPFSFYQEQPCHVYLCDKVVR